MLTCRCKSSTASSTSLLGSIRPCRCNSTGGQDLLVFVVLVLQLGNIVDDVVDLAGNAGLNLHGGLATDTVEYAIAGRLTDGVAFSAVTELDESLEGGYNLAFEEGFDGVFAHLGRETTEGFLKPRLFCDLSNRDVMITSKRRNLFVV